MAKKLSLLVATVAVVAFVVPASAQAAPELTIGGKKAGTFQTVTATSTNMTTQTSLGLLTCASVAMHGEVRENSGSSVSIWDDFFSGNTKGTLCSVGGKPVPVENVTLSKLRTNWSGSISFSLSFGAKIGAVSCSFSAFESLGTYFPGGSPLIVEIFSANLLGTPAACEPGWMNGTFVVTSPGGTVVLH